MRNILSGGILALIFILTASQVSLAQEKPTEWTQHKEVDGVLVEYKYADCKPRMGYDQELVLLRFTNTSDDVLIFDWDLETWQGESCHTCKYPDEYHMELKLGPGGVLEGDCTVECDYRLKIFSKFTDTQYNKEQIPLTRFELANLKVKSIAKEKR